MGLSLLIVEDEQDISMMLEDRLTSVGFYISTAKNGAEGMAMLNVTAFDGILLDIQMPVMDGLTMLKHMRERFPNIPVMVMSAEFNKDKLIQAIEQGAKDYLLKPIDGDLLFKKCSRVFSSNVNRREWKPSQ